MKSIVSYSPERLKSNYYWIGSLTWEFDASERDEVLSLLIQCIARLPEMEKKILAMYYSENFELSEIAMAIGLAEYETDQMLGRALAGLQAKLATELGLAGVHHRRALVPSGLDISPCFPSDSEPRRSYLCGTAEGAEFW